MGLERAAFESQFSLRVSAHVVSSHSISLRVSAHVVQRGWAWHASPQRRRRNRVCFVGTCIRFVDTCIIAVSHSTDGPHIGGCVTVFFFFVCLSLCRYNVVQWDDIGRGTIIVWTVFFCLKDATVT